MNLKKEFANHFQLVFKMQINNNFSPNNASFNITP